MTTEHKDVWAVSDAYEAYVGRWSRLVAKEFVAWLGVPPGRQWLDVGCGTGALSRIILEEAAPRQVTGIDPSDGFVAFARQTTTDDRVAFEIADAQALLFPDAAFDATVAGLVLNFVADPAKAAGGMRRVTRSGGIVAAYVWDYAGEMQMMRCFWNAAIALDPAALFLDEGRRFPLCQPGALSDLFAGAGLARLKLVQLTCRPCSRTSATTGRPSSAVRDRPPATACRFPRIVAKS
jgi:SAM-dependent methyltransferase